ncbi:MAG TPA: hypothetical protein VEY93_11210 [Longimicrobium sp.]|jgi:hypothetical protein|nr:hypothetical protein [Longimicrobium sp.]
MMVRRWGPGLPLILLLLLGGCPQETAVWVAEGSTADELTLVFGRKRGRERPISSVVRVDRCDDANRDSYEGKALWIVSVDTSRMTYGVTGPGVFAETKAAPLTPDCYFVSMSGTGSASFVVDSTGGVTELDEVP